MEKITFAKTDGICGIYLTDESCGDDYSLNLRCALINLGNASISKVTFGPIFGGVTVSTVDLNRMIGDETGGLRGEDLGHGRFFGIAPALILEVGSLEGQQTSGF